MHLNSERPCSETPRLYVSILPYRLLIPPGTIRFAGNLHKPQLAVFILGAIQDIPCDGVIVNVGGVVIQGIPLSVSFSPLMSPSYPFSATAETGRDGMARRWVP